MRRGLLIVLCALAGLIVGGCGGGGNSYADKANTICKDFEKSAPKIGAGSSPDKAQELVVSMHNVAGKLQALDAPSDKKAGRDRFVSLLNQFAGLLEGAANAVRDKDQAALLAIQPKIAALPAQIRTAQSDAGLPRCGTGSS